jgi:hypothetical protein
MIFIWFDEETTPHLDLLTLLTTLVGALGEAFAEVDIGSRIAICAIEREVHVKPTARSECRLAVDARAF